MEEPPPRPAPGHQDGQNYYYVVVEDGNGGVDIIAGQPQENFTGTPVPANVLSSPDDRAPFNFVVWTAILLFVVAALFGMLHCYWKRFVASDANTVADVYNSNNRQPRRRQHEDEDEGRKQKREMKIRTCLLDDMTTRQMIWTISANITTTKKTHNNNNKDDHNDDGGGDLETGNITTEVPVVATLSDSCSSVTSDCDSITDDDDKSNDDNQVIQKSLMFSDSATTSMMCAICLDDYEEGDEVVRSCHPDCDHIFHRDCLLDTFVKRKNRKDQDRTTDGDDENDTKHPCPICRRPHFFYDRRCTNNSNTTDVSKDDDDDDGEENATTIIDESTMEDDISEVEDDNGGGGGDGDASSTTSRRMTAENDNSLLNVDYYSSGGQDHQDGSQNQQTRENDIEEGIIEPGS
mmetsp:Transcript_38612/g.93561  ORF Transcript_38612/g.93561 Transcript_38612/m.93561 type:complete len:406 (-) Transcript_38612:67-1284(-)